MRHTFESLGYQSGFYLSQLFGSNRNSSPSSSITSKQTAPLLRPPPLYNWNQRMMPSPPSSMLASPNYQRPPLSFGPTKDDTHMFLMPHSSEGSKMEEVTKEHESDIKWPNGLSFFNALTGRVEVFNPEGLGNKADETHQDGPNLNEFLTLDSHPDGMRKMENKFRRSFTLPTRMTSSSSSTTLDHHHNQQHPAEYRNPEAGMYHVVMETFME